MAFVLFDMHCHLGFYDDAARQARELSALGVGAFSNTVTPEEFVSQQAALAGAESVRVGVGLHPWWVGEGGGEGAAAGGGSVARVDCASHDIEAFCDLVAQNRFVGEVGLDLSPRHAETGEAQLEVFSHVARTSARAGGKVLSLHAVRAVDQVLDVLEGEGTLAESAGNACVIHWFSGTSDQLTRARRAGCYFSVNPRMLQSKRGRAYAQAIPADRLLLETDEPASEGAPSDAARIRQLLEDTLRQLAALRAEDPDDLRERIAAISKRLLGYPGSDSNERSPYAV